MWWKIFFNFFTIILFQLSVSDGDMNEGEFNIVMKEFGPCNDSMCGTKEIQMNVYLHKRSKSVTKIAGNFTNTIPYDNNLQMEVNFWRFHSERGYQKVPLSLKLNRACSDSQIFWGKEWHTMFQNSKNTCPIPTGVHVISGLSVDQIIKQKTNMLPTQLIYGRYKVIAHFMNKRNNIVVGCFYGVAYFKPDWKRMTEE